MIASSSTGVSLSSDSISDNHSTHSVTGVCSTTHKEARHSIVLPTPSGEKSLIYDINSLTDSSSSDPDDLPGTKLTSCTRKHKQKTNTRFQHRTPEPIDTTQLPFDIDGDVVYRLPYDPEKRMKSSLDGRPWKTWITSPRKGYPTQHTVKEAITATIFNVPIGNSIKLQTAHSLRRRKVKLYANPVGYVQYILIAQLLKYGNSLETASYSHYNTHWKAYMCCCTQTRLFQTGNSIH